MRFKHKNKCTSQLIQFQMRNVIGNPYVHIFGIGLPVLLAMLITRIACMELQGNTAIIMVSTSVYLGMGTLIPMAVLLMGYAVSYAQELSKGIPERMHLFGFKNSVLFCSCAIAQMLFLLIALVIFFLTGIIISGIKIPTVSGLISYILCIFFFSMICLTLAHGIASICRNFGKTYCVCMILYFAFMILGGMMGIQYEDLPKWAQHAAKLLPVTYINKDFYQIWVGKQYNFMPMIQSFLFFGAISVILLFIALKRPSGVRKSI